MKRILSLQTLGVQVAEPQVETDPSSVSALATCGPLSTASFICA